MYKLKISFLVGIEVTHIKVLNILKIVQNIINLNESIDDSVTHTTVRP